MRVREYYIDVIKTMAVVCLFIAHVDAPAIIQELRGFDVPLMVFLSGMLAVESYRRTDSDSEYILKRMERLVIPTWIFLVIFYTCMCLVGEIPPVENIVGSFLFQRDCGLAGGVWIILVYVECSVLMPFLYRVIQSRKSIGLAISVMLGYEMLVSFTDIEVNRLLYYSVCTFVPYGMIMMMGMVFGKLCMNEKLVLASVTAAIHFLYIVVFYLRGFGYIPISLYKYPAQLYYLTYSLPVSIFLIMLLKHYDAVLPRLRIVSFISIHSLWIYLWQILFLTIVKYVLHINENWVLCLIIMLVGSCSITWLQNAAIETIRSRRDYPWLKFFTC